MLLYFIFALLFIGALVYFSYFKIDDCVVLQTIKLDDIIIEIVDEQCKEGLPHTTGPQVVRMTRNAWNGPRRDAILRHERVHLAQKGSNAVDWFKFYENMWDYKCTSIPPVDIPAELVAARRPNPDTDNCPWAIWRNRYVFFPAFSSDKTLRGAEVIIWDLVEGRRTSIPESWRAEFCGNGDCPHQYEHPHEISAEWLTENTAKTPAAYKLFAWNK